MAQRTNTERIEANTSAIRTIECTVAVHEQRLETLDGQVRRLEDGHATLAELAARTDERLKHLERMADRTWRLLLTTLGAVGALIVGLILRVLAT